MLTDFRNRFDTSDHDALVDRWSEMVPVLKNILVDQFKVNLLNFWCNDICDILTLLRLMPLKNVGRNLGTVLSFNKAVDKLFVFRQVRTYLIWL